MEPPNYRRSYGNHSPYCANCKLVGMREGRQRCGEYDFQVDGGFVCDSWKQRPGETTFI